MKSTQEIRRTLIAPIAVGIVVFVSSTGHAAGRAKILKCEGLFQSSNELQTSSALAVSPRAQPTSERALTLNKKSGAIVDEVVPMHIKEQIVLEAALQHYVGSHRIPLEYASGVDAAPRSAEGEFVAVSFLTDVKPALGSSDSLRLGSSAANAQLGYSRERNAVAVFKARPTTVAEVSARGLNPVEILTNFVRHETTEAHLDDSAVNFIVTTMMKDADYMGRAVAYHESRTLRVEGQTVGRQKAVNLANSGLYRYFRFTPHGSSQEVIARVLDINHVIGRGAGFNVLVEWMRPANDMAVRTRHVQSLKVSELESMRPIADSVRRLIEIEFNESLSPQEVATQKMAERSGLRTFGFTEISRKAGGSETGADPYSAMTGVAHTASRTAVEKRFGKFDDLLTSEEKSLPQEWRIFDIMARLNPKFVLNRFNGRGTGFVYMFVITEDGQLKITPFVEGSMNYKPELLRFAHGRRIFAGGTFTIGKDGRLEVTLESNGYQAVEDPLALQMAYRTNGQQNLNSFVAYAFHMQAGRQISNLGSEFAEAFFNASSYEDRTKAYVAAKDRYLHDPGFKSAGSASDRGFDSSQAFAGFTTRNIFEEARRDVWAEELRKNANGKKSLSEWSDKDGPLSLEAYMAAAESTGINSFEIRRAMELRGGFVQDFDAAMKMSWAYYVLRANPQMSFEQIKGLNRRLRTKFYPDKVGAAEEAQMRAKFQVVKAAYEAIEKSLGR